MLTLDNPVVWQQVIATDALPICWQSSACMEDTHGRCSNRELSKRCTPSFLAKTLCCDSGQVGLHEEITDQLTLTRDLSVLTSPLKLSHGGQYKFEKHSPSDKLLQSISDGY